MRKLLCCLLLLLLPVLAKAEGTQTWRVVTEDGTEITQICTEPAVGDEYISADNMHYEIVRVDGDTAQAAVRGSIMLPDTSWLDANDALPVSSRVKTITMYCTHSDESYEPSDGFYTTNQRGTIYQVAAELATALQQKGIEVSLSDRLHHPHDAGAYRRSRQTAVQLLTEAAPDCLIDIHRDGIPDPASYETEIGGQQVSKIRLLVGRGNQNAEANKEFALMIKAVADHIYPGLIKDIYLGKGTYNQDLLPRSILLECGTHTLEKERVLRSMPLMADVLNRVLYGGVVGSAGRISSDVQPGGEEALITEGEPDPQVNETKGVGYGYVFLGFLLFVGIVGVAVLSKGSVKGGLHKAGRNLHEMTGGLIGTPPQKDERPDE